MPKSLQRTPTPRLERRDGPELRHAGGAFEIRALSDAGEFEGYGSVFGVEDSYGDIVAPGAFKASLEEHRAAGTMPAMLWQHDASLPIGVYTDMLEDTKGLLVKGKILTELDKGREALAMLKAKVIRGLSIGFITRKWQWDEGKGIRTVLDVDLWEVSCVTFAAQKLAQVTDVKGADLATERDLEKFLREAGKSKAEAKAIVARVRSSILQRRDVSDGIGSAMASADRLLKSIQGD